MHRHSEEDLLRDLDITDINKVEPNPENLVYTGIRKGKKVRIYIIDQDPSVPEYRYVCKIAQDDWRSIQGNGGQNGIDAILNTGVHISQLDE